MTSTTGGDREKKSKTNSGPVEALGDPETTRAGLAAEPGDEPLGSASSESRGIAEAEESKLNSQPGDEPQSTASAAMLDEIRSAISKLISSRSSSMFDRSEPFWQYMRIATATGRPIPQSIRGAEALLNAEEMYVIPKMLASNDPENETPHKKQKLSNLPMAYLSTYSQDDSETYYSTYSRDDFDEPSYTAVLDLEWGWHVDKRKVVQPLREDFVRVKEEQSWLNDPAYQCKNHSEACHNLGIVDEQYLQIPGMRQNAVLEEWQPVAVHRLNQIRRMGLTRGAILADAVGLGKSWEALALMMHMVRTGSHQGKPFIVVAPSLFVDQWAEKIHAITDIFHIWIYAPDRQGDDASSENRIVTRLEEQHEVFGSKEQDPAVVVTSYETLSSTHGPSAVKKWCRNHAQVYDPDALDMPARCTRSLRGKFSMAVFDEAHLLCTRRSGFSLAGMWLHAPFNLLLTATPFFRDIRDFDSYAPILLWPYPLPANAYDPTRLTSIFHSAFGSDDSRILCSREFVFKHVLAPDIDPPQCQLRIRAILKHLMVRRTVASCVWLDSDRKISACHPPALRLTMITPFKDAELQIYQHCADKYQSDFLEPSPKRCSIYKWDMHKLRQVLMGSTWIGLIALERRLASTSLISDIEALNDGRNEVLQRFREALEKDGIPMAGEQGRSFYQKPLPAATGPDAGPSDGNRDPLHLKSEGLDLLLHGSPKMRSLIESLQHQVCLLGEKAVIWTYHPGEEAFVGAALHETGIPFAILHPDSQKERRDSIIADFTDTSGNGCMVLVLSYLVPSLDLNLHLACRQVHLFSPPPSRAAFDQAVGRVLAFQCGQTRPVTIFEHQVPNTLNINLDRHSRWSDLPGFQTNMCKSLAPNLKKGAFDLRWYVIRDDQIVALGRGERLAKGDIRDPWQTIERLKRSIWNRS